MNTVDASKIGRILYNSLRNSQTIPPLTETISNISIDDAYEISKLTIKDKNYKTKSSYK
jgi:2-keto-4-pentenoate hydratase